MTTLEFSNTQRVIQQPRGAARVYLATSKLEEERTTIPRPAQTVTRCMSTRQMTTTIASPPMECEIRVIAARFVVNSSSVRRPERCTFGPPFDVPRVATAGWPTYGTACRAQ